MTIELHMGGGELHETIAGVNAATHSTELLTTEMRDTIKDWDATFEANHAETYPRITSLLKWAKAAFIAVCFASFAIIIAALSIIIG